MDHTFVRRGSPNDAITKNNIPLIVIGLIIILYVVALFILNRTYLTQIHNLESRLRMLETNQLPNKLMDRSGGSAAS